MIPKFRGFRTKTEEWVEGNLIYREEPYQHDIVTPIGNCSTISYAVERDSIGQWTGLKDKNGVEIYEGDYLSLIDFEVGREYKGEIVFSRGSFCVAIQIKGHDVEVALYETTEVDSLLEVLGNIYENPELLEVPE